GLVDDPVVEGFESDSDSVGHFLLLWVGGAGAGPRFCSAVSRLSYSVSSCLLRLLHCAATRGASVAEAGARTSAPRSVWIGRTNPVRPVYFDRWARRPLPWLAFPALLYGEGARALFLSPGSRAARTGARRSSNRPADRGP